MQSPHIDILLITSPPWGIGNPNIGIAYLSSFLRRRGFSVHSYDMNIDLFRKAGSSFQRLWEVENYHCWGETTPVDEIFGLLSEPLKETIASCMQHNASVFGLGCTYSNLNFVLRLASVFKAERPELKIVFGGPGTNSEDSRRKIEDSGAVDALVVGEGERPLAAYLAEVATQHEPKAVPGLQVFGSHKAVPLSPPKLEGSLDDYPFPDFFGLDLSNYCEESLPIVFTRGCRSRCSFCEVSLLWHTYRSRGIESVVGELEHHIEKLGIRKFRSFDSAINLNRKLLEALITEIMLREWGSKIEWDGSFIAGPRYDLEFFRRLRGAGCKTLYFGLESGSNNVLELMKKPFRVEHVRENIRDATKAGIEVYLNIIVGFPGETERDFMETMTFLRENQRSVFRVGAVTTLQLVEGTPLYKNADRYNLEIPKGDFSVGWKTKDGANTFDIRNERQNRLLTLLDELGLAPPICASLNDDDKLPNLKLPRDKPGSHLSTECIDFVLVSLPPWDLESPPYGLCALKTFLESKGIQVQLMDLNLAIFQLVSPSLRSCWQFENVFRWVDPKYCREIFAETRSALEEMLGHGLKKPCRFIGLSLLEQNLSVAKMVFELLRKIRPDSILVAGGPACFSLRRVRQLARQFDGLVDYFVVGEGELIAADLAMKTGSNFVGIPGVFDPKFPERFQPRAQIENLDVLPFPKYEDYFISEYLTRSVCLSWSRGCKGNCSFCNVRSMWPQIRVRSPAHILEELEYHVEKCGIRDFNIFDSAINVARSHLNAVLDGILERHWDIHWSALAIPSEDLRRDTLVKLRRAGCFRLDIGIESGSAKVLRAYRKPSTPISAARVLQEAREAGIKTSVLLMTGFPEEDEEDFLATCAFLRENREFISRISQINAVCVLPETRLESQLEMREDFVPGIEEWSLGENTLSFRKERVRRLAVLARDLGLQMVKSNCQV